MALASYFGYSPFLRQKDLNAVARQMRCRQVGRKQWVALHEDTGIGLLRSKARQSSVLLGFATAYKMPLERLERVLVRELERRKGVVGIRCRDAVLVHPTPLGKALLTVLQRLERTVQ